MHSGPSPLPLSWSSEPKRPVLALWIALALTLFLLAVTAQSAAGLTKRYTLQRNKNVLFDKEQVLPEGTEFKIKMSAKPGYRVDCLLMTKEDYDSYNGGGVWTYTAEGSFLDVESYDGSFKVPEKAHWVWVVDNTNQPEGGAYANDNIWIDAAVDIEKTNLWALFALLFFICLLILILLSFIYNRWHMPKDTGHRVEKEDPLDPNVHVTTERYHRDIELPGHGTAHYEKTVTKTYEGVPQPDDTEDDIVDHEPEVPPAMAAAAVAAPDRQSSAVRTSSATTVPGNVNPDYHDKPAYIKRREARGEGLGGIGTAAPEEARTETGPEPIPGPDGEPSEFSHCTTCFAIVPTASTFCYRCKASLT